MIVIYMYANYTLLKTIFQILVTQHIPRQTEASRSRV